MLIKDYPPPFQPTRVVCTACVAQFVFHTDEGGATAYSERSARSVQARMNDLEFHISTDKSQFISMSSIKD